MATFHQWLIFSDYFPVASCFIRLVELRHAHSLTHLGARKTGNVPEKNCAAKVCTNSSMLSRAQKKVIAAEITGPKTKHLFGTEEAE